MQYYQTKTGKITGSDFKEIHRKAKVIYEKISKKSKRRPYMRSKYFRKSKIFLGLFWHHVFEKYNYGDQMRRIKFLPCALELIEQSHLAPISKEHPNNKSEILHRFYGQTIKNEQFIVQIKEDRKSGEKFLISVFPAT